MALDDVGGVGAQGRRYALAGGGCVEAAVGHGEHAQAVGGVGVVGLHDAGAQLVGHGYDLAAHANLVRQAHDLVGGALREGDATRPVDGVLESVDGRHALAAALEGQLLHARHAALELGGVDAALLGGHDQAGLGGIAVDLVAPALLLGGVQARVAAQQAAFQQKLEVGVVHGAVRGASGLDAALGRVAHAGDLVLARGRPQVVDGHLVLGERAGLIGADDARGAEGLDGVQLLHEGVAAAHALHRHGERQGDRGQQALGDEGHHHAQREDEGLREGLVHHEQAEGEEGEPHAHGEDGDLLGEAVEVALERAADLLHVLREVRDLAELGGHADAQDDRAPVALRHARAREDQVGDLGGGEPVLGDGVGGLARGVRLAVQRGLVHLQVGARDDAGVGRDPVALREEHDVARDQVLGEHLLLPSPADHVGVGGQHLLQGLRRLAGAVLLPEAEDAVDDVDEPDGAAQLGQPRDERDGARHPQQDGHEMGEVGQEGQHGRALPGGFDQVLPVAPLALGGLLVGQAARTGPEQRERRVRRGPAYVVRKIAGFAPGRARSDLP